MPSLFKSSNITTVHPHVMVRLLRYLQERFRRQQGRQTGKHFLEEWFHLLYRLSSYWQQRPIWLRDPLAIIIMAWGGCCLWNFEMAVAIAIGTIVAIAVYLSQLNRLHIDWQWSQYSLHANKIARLIQPWHKVWLQQWRRSWKVANRPLTLSLLSGIGGVIALKSLWSIFQATHSWVLAAIVGGQTGAIAIIGKLLWQQQQMDHLRNSLDSRSSIALTQETTRETEDPAWPTNVPDTIWVELASSHPPTRLIAVYRAMEWIQAYRLANNSGSALPLDQSKAISRLMTCLRLMLTYETHPALKQAIQEALIVFQTVSSTTI